MGAESMQHLEKYEFQGLRKAFGQGLQKPNDLTVVQSVGKRLEDSFARVGKSSMTIQYTQCILTGIINRCGL